MSTTLKSKSILFSMLLLALGSNAQDLIIKNDKTEFKSKVLEITDATIKYKKWENIEGPTYNIDKKEVFMIVYENGEKESFSKSANTPADSSASKTTHTNQAVAATSDPNAVYKKLKVDYKPFRMYAGLQSPLSLGISTEFRIIKNAFNLGFDAKYNFPKDEYTLESGTAFIYGSVYFPINRLIGNYKKQNKGLFIFGQAGYGINYVKTTVDPIIDYGFMWRTGTDYFFTDRIGLSLFTTEFKSFYGGITFSL